MKHTSAYSLILFGLITIFWGCTNNSAPENQSQSTDSQSVANAGDTTPISETGIFIFQYTIGNLPAPVSVLEEYANSGLEADLSLLNPYKKADNYQTSVSRAFNFGIYGIDLAYLVVNKKSIDVLNYYSCTRKLAQELNIAETFDQFTQRFESNVNIKDSLLRIIDDAYVTTENYLKTNERLAIASEILAGSWIESQYLTINLLKNTERNSQNDTLYQKVWEQKFHLDNIDKLFKEITGSDESNKIKADLDALLLTYKDLKDSQSVNKAFLEKLAGNLARIRNNITK